MGKNIKGNEKVIEKMYNSNMEIGNHTFNHLLLTKYNKEKINEEIMSTNNAIFNIFSLLFISFGIISYLILLQKYILKYLNYLFNKVAKKVLIIRLKLKVKYDKIIMERRKRKLEYEKNKRTKGSHKKEKQN
jgi:peptidoglycan/xylan/chitin deacetylase (PgdA/CDA1 family)